MAFQAGPLGWVRNDAAVEAFCQKVESSGRPIAFGDAKPEFKGYWRKLVERGVTGVFLQDAEEKLFGSTQPAEFQRRGTCVSRGTFRACQDSYYNQLATHDIGSVVKLCYEPIYAGSRVEIGGGQLGHGDGSCGAWAAEFVHDYGLIPRGIYGKYDLTESREDWACQWGEPRIGVPSELLVASKAHLVAQCFQCTTTEEIADAIASLHGVAFCSNVIWGDRDVTGMSRPVSSGGHCEEVCGVFLRREGDIGFVRQQSWGDSPSGSNILRYSGGEKRLRQGSYGAFDNDLGHAMAGANGDVWAFGGITGWRPKDTAEALR